MRHERLLRAALLVAALSITHGTASADTPAPSTPPQGAPVTPAPDGPVAPVTRVPEAVQLAPTESAPRAATRTEADSTTVPYESLSSGRYLGFSAGALVLVVALLVTML